MPREAKSLVREGGFRDAEKFFILAFEGKKSEPIYFEYFRNSDYFNNSGRIELVPLKKTKNSGTDPFSVKKLLSEAKKEYNFKAGDEFWLIIDRDHWEKIHKLSLELLVAECKNEKNFFIAMSNPCFEIWLLLHLKDLSEFSAEEKEKIYRNEKINNSKKYIQKLLEELQGRGYKKRPNPNIYLPLTRVALERAKALDILGDDYPPFLGSHIYKLIEKIIK